VVATGPWTEVGRIHSLVTDTRAPITPMQRELERLGRQMVFLACGISGAVFVVGLFRGFGLLELVKTTVSLAVAAVPEGLPTVTTTTLAAGMRRMRERNVLVRRLDAVETLGAVQVVCLDKTGTITTNRMTTVAAFAGGRRWRADGLRLVPDEGPETDGELRRLLEVAALCNEADIEGDHLSGSPTEVALLRAAVAAGIDVAALRTAHPVTRTEHRSERRMYMATWHDLGEGRTLLAVKGRPDEVLALCTRQRLGRDVQDLTAADRLDVETANERMAVAMTGDGINDGPALRAADIGVAMGRDGASLAREVADVVLMEDDILALIPGIAQGRTIYDAWCCSG
jgi:Ca2+-transporting ATPase